MTDKQDEELMLAFQKGSETAFAELLGRHHRGVYNFLYRGLKGAQDAEEAFQEVFIRVIRAAANYQPSAKFTTWLYTIARHYCIDATRRAQHRQTISLDDRGPDSEGYALGETLADDHRGPEGRAQDGQVAEILAQALAAINPDQREVFLLREEVGLSFEEVAEVVGISINTAKSRMRYALSALRNILAKDGL